MGNTLFVYGKKEGSQRLAYRAACILAMSRVVSVAALPELTPYGRIVAVGLSAEECGILAAAVPAKKGKWLALVGAEGEEKDLDLFDFSCAVGDGVDLETIQSVVEALQDAMPPADVLPPSIILARIEDFLRHHNTCALATSYGEDVRNTTIEYGYDNGIVYLFSEGGKKFANIFRNPRVSIAVFDNYIDFSHIGGLRLDGIAAVYEIGHPLYEKGAALRGISVERLAGMAVPLHLIAVTLTAGDFLWHGFKNDGGFAHQRYYLQ